MRSIDALYIGIAAGIGVLSALQTGMLASLGKSRGPTEATWISLLSTLSALALVLAFRSLLTNPPSLPSPFRNPVLFAAITVLAGAGLLVSLKGLHPYLGLAGVFGFAYVVAAAFVAPRAGITLYVAAVTAGTLAGSVLLDHYGAFGEVHRATVLRLLGVVALLAGVLLVRADS